jgi:hypothetical protein
MCWLRVRYESLVHQPEDTLAWMARRLDLDRPDNWTIPDKLVGWFPSGGKRDGWRELWNADDERWFYERVPRGFFGVMDDHKD